MRPRPFISRCFAWRSKLRPITNADQRRELYLDRAQRLKFIQKAPDDLAVFLRGLCQLPLRPGALAKLDAGEFDRRLKVLKIGQDGTRTPDTPARWEDASSP